MADDDAGVFEPFLDEDELILWTGKPDTHILLTPADVLLVPVSILIGISFINRGLKYIFGGIDIGYAVLAVWGTLFILMGGYLMLGRLFYKIWRKKRTHYALTNRRILVYARGRRMVAEEILQIPALGRSVRTNGSGTITFGPSPFTASWCGNTGMNCLAGFDHWDLLGFHDIKDANHVYAILETLRGHWR
ncbi:MAG: hypothetical protein ABFD46_02670 [Armatimonadota bacterium]